jgi:hypothetical protein
MPRSSDLLENNMRFQRESWKMRASRILHPGCGVHGSDNEWEDAPYGYMGWLGKLARKLLIRSRGVYKCIVGLKESNAVASSVIADYLARHGR